MLHPNYRPDIDGIRALAVLFVIGFHAFPEAFPFGFIGVDLFFVISGYLISQVIFNNLNKNSFSFSEFYIRRILRIFPALILVLLFCYAYGWWDWLADDFAQLGKHITAGALFVSNFLLWQESGYFDQSAELKPLLHLWSLGIEEQFYLLWPLFIYLLWRYRNSFSIILLSLIFLSFTANVLLIEQNPVAAFYAPWTRFWELTIGSYLAYVNTIKNKSPPAPSHAAYFYLSANQLTTLGLVFIIIGGFFISSKSAFPGWWALLPVGAAYCWIAAGSSAWFNQTILSQPFLIRIGLISYPLYLWHWPLLAFARMQEGGQPSISTRLILVICAFILAWITYQLIEKPIRFKTSWRKTKWISLCLLMAIVAYLGYNCFDRNGITFRHKRLIQDISSYTFDKVREQRQRTCFLMDKGDDRTHFERECTRMDRPFKLVLWGDSHGGSLYPGFANLERNNPQVAVSQFTAAGCGGLLPTLEQGEFCKSANESALKQILKIKPNLLVIHKAWHTESAPLLQETIRAMRQQGIPVLIIGPTPRWTVDLPNIVYRYWKKHGQLPPQYSKQSLDPKIEMIDQEMRKATIDAGGMYFSAWDLLCKKDEGCMNRLPGDENILVTLDEDHITPAAAKFIVNAVEGQVANKILLESQNKSK